jgi:Tfp pilus assembly protein PilF
MGSVFRVGRIERQDDGIWSVHLTLTGDTDPQLNSLIKHIRNEIIDTDPLIKLATILFKMGQHNKAERFYRTAFATVNHWKDLARIHNDLGLIYWDTKKLDDALQQFQRSLAIKREREPHNSSFLVPVYNSIGMIYSAKKQFALAHRYYKLALDIECQVPNPNQQEIASIFNNIANDLCDQGKYVDGMSGHQQVLELRLNVLPSTHPLIAMSYSNIGKCLYSMGCFEQAVNNAQTALRIDLKSLPSDHPQIKIHQKDLDTYQRAIQS